MRHNFVVSNSEYPFACRKGPGFLTRSNRRTQQKIKKYGSIGHNKIKKYGSIYGEYTPYYGVLRSTPVLRVLGTEYSVRLTVVIIAHFISLSIF